MPPFVVPIAAWLVREAYKLIAVPVGSDARERLADRFIDKITDPVWDRLFHDHAPDPGGAPSAAASDVAYAADLAFVDTIEDAPQDGLVLGREMGQILGVNLTADGVKRKSPEWYVSAYAAIFWRIAMLAVWEKRPIAVQGALQGREWITVCFPHVSSAIDPSAMWRPANSGKLPSGTLLRVLHNSQPADFFVRQSKDDSVRRDAVSSLNKQFMMDPRAKLEPAKGKRSIVNDWHRVNGFNRNWVLLKLDSAAEQAVRESRSSLKDIFGKTVAAANLELQPPTFNEYPKKWQPLLEIESEAGGIAALSAGADEFARVSEASAEAVDAVLPSDPADV